MLTGPMAPIDQHSMAALEERNPQLDGHFGDAEGHFAHLRRKAGTELA